MGASEGLAAPRAGTRGRVRIRPLEPDDVPAAATLVADGFPRRRAVGFLPGALLSRLGGEWW